MTSWGRQYPDGPLETALGDLVDKPTWLSDDSLRKPFAAQSLFPDGAGALLGRLLNPELEPGPPYVHTLAPPPEPWYSRSGRLVYRPPVPKAFTLIKRPVADLVREAGFGPVPQRIEVTAGFCQCPACRDARYEHLTGPSPSLPEGPQETR